jgi:hypothetical protein
MLFILLNSDEWKQMKAEGRSPPPYTNQSSVQDKLKRQFSKNDKPSSNESSMKKSKATSADEKFKIEPTSEEIVVQTSEGLMKFKGISRSFTRKLYEWEKAKGIEPESESSTFALLQNPKFKAIINPCESIDHDTDKGMKRALSVDSIKPVQSMSQISQQPSSLSLNDADSMKESNDRRVML